MLVACGLSLVDCLLLVASGSLELVSSELVACACCLLLERLPSSFTFL
jgi:hypothetical protein